MLWFDFVLFCARHEHAFWHLRKLFQYNDSELIVSNQEKKQWRRWLTNSSGSTFLQTLKTYIRKMIFNDWQNCTVKIVSNLYRNWNILIKIGIDVISERGKEMNCFWFHHIINKQNTTWLSVNWTQDVVIAATS